MATAPSIPIKLFEVYSEKDPATGKPRARSRSLGEIAMPFVSNKEKRKTEAKQRAEAHVGRASSNVSHTPGDGMSATFREEKKS